MTVITAKMKILPYSIEYMKSIKNKAKSYEDMIVWQKAMDLTEEIYRQALSFPGKDSMGITEKLKLAAVSVPDNIAEGSLRKNEIEFSPFLNEALKELANVRRQVSLAHKMEYLSDVKSDYIRKKSREIGDMLEDLRIILIRKVGPTLDTSPQKNPAGY